jgi:hypothetical protein
MNAPVTGGDVSRTNAGRPRLRIDLGHPMFTDKVLADVERIRQTAAGRALFRRLSHTGRGVSIERPKSATIPPNAWTLRPVAGRETDIVIVYDPLDWPGPEPYGSLPSDVVLFGRLEDAAAMVTDAALPAIFEAGVSTTMTIYLNEREAVPTLPESVPT